MQLKSLPFHVIPHYQTTLERLEVIITSNFMGFVSKDLNGVPKTDIPVSPILYIFVNYYYTVFIYYQVAQRFTN